MIEVYLRRQGYAMAGKGRPKNLDVWEAWYKGYVPDFHAYTVACGKNRTHQAQRYRTGMAQTVCADFGSLLMNERVQITSDALGSELGEVLSRNAFHTRMNRLAELTMALGTGAIIIYRGGDGAPVIDYVNAKAIYPLKWDNETVTECAFASSRIIGEGEKTGTGTYVQTHVQRNGKWIIRNAMLDASGRQVALPQGIVEETQPSPIPLFYLMRPNTVNPDDPDGPMGASVFAGAIDQLKGADVIYDSYINEFVLGKKRLLVPLSLSTAIAAENGMISPVFDPRDTLFYTYADGSEDGAKKLTELDMHLRTAEHEQGLQRQLDMISKKCGLGVGRYQFDAAGVHTATEVISAKSDLYQSLKRHEKTFGDAIAGMVRAIGYLLGRDPEKVDAAIHFDDSIIEDTNAAMDRVIKLTGAGLMSKKRALMELYSLDEAEAERRVREIAAEEAITQGGVEMAMYTAGGEA